VAAQLLAQKVRVAIAGRHEETVAKALELLRPQGEVVGFVADVGDPQACQKLVEDTVAWGGGLDILVNNAAIAVFKPFLQMTLEEWQEQIRVNLLGPYYCARFALPHLLASQGFIINVASLAARHPVPEATAYTASKFGLLGFSQALMEEVRQQGVRVAAILPGSVDTELAGKRPGASWKLSPEEVAQGVLALLTFPERALPSLLELRPARPQKG
jgi:NAD(P)-dependent dehydrogenase (short-subunit alcohol dehydrogenase family)